MHKLTIDIVSDVSCPWCVIGYQALKKALDNKASELTASIQWHPFELNPNMPKEGQEINEHLAQKYRINEQQIQQNQEVIRQRGVSLGYEFSNRGGGRIYNTFDAHRLLHWAAEQGKQTELKLAFFDLYFKEAGDPSDHQQLLVKVKDTGLDEQIAISILSGDRYAAEVRQQQQYYQALGISSVPAVIVNKKHLISGGQPVDVFEQALLNISQQEA